ncbi:hypothetical protein GCM10023336_27670 [Streptomyces similanensis]|uniref:Uncharacterized protein n=1 Tax=Streptomyces similanensis TaxID=1274988 RepID=A0ABP9KFI2_9ACTN
MQRSTKRDTRARAPRGKGGGKHTVPPLSTLFQVMNVTSATLRDRNGIQPSGAFRALSGPAGGPARRDPGGVSEG